MQCWPLFSVFLLRSHYALLLLSISHTTYKARHRGGLSTSQNSEEVSRAFSKYQKLWNGRHGPAERYSVHEMSIRIVHSLDIYSIFFFDFGAPICTALDRVRDDYLAESQQAVDTIQAKKSNSSNKLKIWNYWTKSFRFKCCSNEFVGIKFT